MLLLAGVVRAVTAVVVGIVVVSIMSTLLEPDESNLVVSWFQDAGSWLAGPFKDLVSIEDDKLALAVNWGIAAVAYGCAGRFVARRMAWAATRVGRGNLSATG